MSMIISLCKTKSTEKTSVKWLTPGLDIGLEFNVRLLNSV